MIIRAWNPITDEIPEGRNGDSHGEVYAQLYFMQDVEYEIYGWWEHGKHRPIGIGGLVYNGIRADFFLYLNDQCTNKPFTFHRLIRKMFKKIIRSYNWIEEYSAFVDQEHPERRKWIESLGFREIGTETLLGRKWWEYKWERHSRL